MKDRDEGVMFTCSWPRVVDMRERHNCMSYSMTTCVSNTACHRSCDDCYGSCDDWSRDTTVTARAMAGHDLVRR